MSRLEALGGITSQHNEIVKRIVNGSLDPSWVRRALQEVIEKRFVFSMTPAEWYVSPEKQLEAVHCLNDLRMWRFADDDFPPVPQEFVPRTATEVLMLNVRLRHKGSEKHGRSVTFEELSLELLGLEGLYGAGNLKRDGWRYSWKAGIRWVAFDPYAYEGLTAFEAKERARAERTTLAGTEVIMAAILFPEWFNRVDGFAAPVPQMAGLRAWFATELWVPTLSAKSILADAPERDKLRPHAGMVNEFYRDRRHPGWSACNPTVRALG